MVEIVVGLLERGVWGVVEQKQPGFLRPPHPDLLAPIVDWVG